LKLLNGIKVILFFIILIFSVKTQSQELIDKIVAVVDNEIILRSEVVLLTQQRLIQLRIDPNVDTTRYERIKEEAFDYLINNKILLAKAIEDTIQVSEEEINRVIDERWQQLIEQLGSESEVEKQTGYTLRQLRKFIREDVKNRLMIERVKANFESKVTISRREVEEFYNSKKDSLPEVPESYNISMILMEIEPGPETMEKARKKIDTIREMLLNGADFAELARNYSDDPGSAKNGGDLGFVTPGTFVKEFDEAVSLLKPGEISPGIKTQFGYHIIEVLEKKGNEYHARHILASLKVTENDVKRTAQQMQDIREQLLNGADFSELALKYSDDPEVEINKGHPGWIILEDVKVPEFISAIRNLEVGEISQPFRTQFGVHIIRLNDKRTKHTLTLEDDWDQVEQMALLYKKNREFNKWLEELKQKMHIEIKDTI